MEKTKKAVLTTLEDLEKGFETITFNIRMSRFQSMISSNKLLCPQLTDSELVTMTISNIMFSYFCTGLDTLWESLSIKLKKFYGYSSNHGSVNHSVEERKEKERKEKEFCPSIPTIFL